jgi:plasmid stabilization system protein ParE
MFYTVVFTPEAEGQLTDLFSYIAGASSPEVAARYTDGIVTCCESLHAFPLRGTARDDIRPGLRITGYQKRVVIAFEGRCCMDRASAEFSHNQDGLRGNI